MNVKIANELLRCGYVMATACGKRVDKVSGKFLGLIIDVSIENEETGIPKGVKHLIAHYQANGTNWYYRVYIPLNNQ